MPATTRNRARSLLRQRRLLVAAAIGATAFVSVYAFAASLNVSSQTLGAGNSVVASCIPNPASVTVSYGTTYDPAVPGYRVSSVTITASTVTPATGLTACAGKTITVDFTGAANASLGEVTTTIATPSPAPTLTIPVPATGASPAPGGAQFPVNAASVTGVSAVIAG